MRSESISWGAKLSLKESKSKKYILQHWKKKTGNVKI